MAEEDAELFTQFSNWHFIARVFILLFSLVIHEFAHAVTADVLGDKTPRMNGRLTLNPIVHLELIGIIAILFAPIGWARPVPINSRNFRHPRRDVIFVTAAGPLSNLLLACIAFVVLRIGAATIDPTSTLAIILSNVILLNISLFIFNLIPIPPLDGSQIVRNLLPLRAAIRYSRMDAYGPFILLLLLIMPFFSQSVYEPLIVHTSQWVGSWFGV